MKEKGIFETLKSLKPKTRYWKNSREMHKVMNKLADYMRGILLELLDNPLTVEGIKECLHKFMARMGGHGKRDIPPDLEAEIKKAVSLDILKREGEKFALTDKGREIAEHMKLAIPVAMQLMASEKAVSMFTITIHIFLSILKLLVGFLARSAGLIADGIDNTADTVSSVLIWFGVKFKKEKITSLFIIIMMFVSVAGIALTSIDKIVSPAPIEGGIGAFIMSLIGGLIMLFLSAYQYYVGKKRGNFAIMCQSVDSRNHFITSIFVCAGILISGFAVLFHAPWLYYSDAVVSVIIGILILKSAIELCVEFFKPVEEDSHVSHFLEKSMVKFQCKMILRWLKSQLSNRPLSTRELDERFYKEFCENTPKLLVLSGIGYKPENTDDLHHHLELFVKRGEVIFQNNAYCLKES